MLDAARIIRMRSKITRFVPMGHRVAYVEARTDLSIAEQEPGIPWNFRCVRSIVGTGANSIVGGMERQHHRSPLRGRLIGLTAADGSPLSQTRAGQDWLTSLASEHTALRACMAAETGRS